MPDCTGDAFYIILADVFWIGTRLHGGQHAGCENAAIKSLLLDILPRSMFGFYLMGPRCPICQFFVASPNEKKAPPGTSRAGPSCFQRPGAGFGVPGAREMLTNAVGETW